MKQIYKSIATVILGIYVGCIGGNITVHGTEAWKALRESQEARYGDNLQKQWKDYSESQLERLTNPRILIPLSCFDFSRPLQVEMVGPVPVEEIQGINPRKFHSLELSGVKINDDGTDPSITSNMSDEEYVKLESEGKIIHNSLDLRCHDTIQLDGVNYLVWCNTDRTIYLLP